MRVIDRSCPRCKGIHFLHPVNNGKPDYDRTVPCECIREQWQAEAKAAVLRRCELPDDSQHMTFESFRRRAEMEETYQVALAFAEGHTDYKTLTLIGKSDLGKTHLAVAICRKWLSLGKPALYTYAPLLLDELRAGFKDHRNDESRENTYEARFNFFLNVPLLLIDDLGVENNTPWVQEKLDTIVDYRIIHGLWLVITTNKPLDQLSARICSRLKRSGRVLVCKGEEYRKVRQP